MIYKINYEYKNLPSHERKAIVAEIYAIYPFFESKLFQDKIFELVKFVLMMKCVLSLFGMIFVSPPQEKGFLVLFVTY